MFEEIKPVLDLGKVCFVAGQTHGDWETRKKKKSGGSKLIVACHWRPMSDCPLWEFYDQGWQIIDYFLFGEIIIDYNLKENNRLLLGGQFGLPRALEAWQALSSDPYGAPPHSAGLSWHSSALFRPSPKIMSGASHVYFPPKGKVLVLKAHFYGHK